MYNNEKRSPRFVDEYDEYDSELTSTRNQRVRSEADDVQETRPNRDFGSSADYNKYIGERPERKINYDVEANRSESNTAECPQRKQNADLLPTRTTMQFVGSDCEYVYEDMNGIDDKEDAIVNKEGLSGKSKIMIAVYAIVVLTIFTLIIMNTRLLKTMDSSINEQEARISELVQENAKLAERYKFVSSDEEVVRRAEDMGMVYSD